MSSVETLKRTLKSWENAFYKQHQRKPCKADIKAEPTIEAKYKEYKRLKLGSSSSSSEGPSSYKHFVHSSQCKSTKERPFRHNHTHEHENIENQGTRKLNQTGTLYDSKTALLTPAKSSPNVTSNNSNFMASPSKQVAEIGPTPQLNGRLLGIFETVEASIGNAGDEAASHPETPPKRTPTKDISDSPNLSKIIITPSIKRKLDFGQIDSGDEEENCDLVIKQPDHPAHKKTIIGELNPRSNKSDREVSRSSGQFRKPDQETSANLRKYATPTNSNRIDKRIVIPPSASAATKTPFHQRLISSPSKIKTPLAAFERTPEHMQFNNAESTPLYLSQGATVLLRPVMNPVSPSKKAISSNCRDYHANSLKQVDSRNDNGRANSTIEAITPAKTINGSSGLASPSLLKSKKRLSSLSSTLSSLASSSSTSLLPSTENATISTTTITSLARQSRSSKGIRRKTLSEIFNEVQEIKKDLQSSIECEEVRMQIEMDRKEQQLMLEVEQQEAKEFNGSSYSNKGYNFSEGNSEFLESDRVDLVGDMGRAVNGFEYDMDELSDIDDHGSKLKRNRNYGNGNNSDDKGYVTNENHKTAYWLKKKKPKRQTRRVKIGGRESLEEEKIIDEGEVKAMIQTLKDNQIGKGHNNSTSNIDGVGAKLGEEDNESDGEEVDDFDEQQEYVSDSGDEYNSDDVEAIIRASHNEKIGFTINGSGKDGKANTGARINNNFKRYKLRRGNSRFKRRR